MSDHRALSPKELWRLRGAKARATEKFTAGGRPKEGSREPKPITLRRADYEKGKEQ